MASKVVKATLSLMLALWTVSAHALPPDAVDDLVVVTEDTPIPTFNVLANDVPDNPGNTLTVDSFVPPAAGVFTLAPTGEADYTPDPEFSGTVTFTYTVQESEPGCNGAGAPPDCFDTATGTIFVAPQADLPTVVTGGSSGDEDTTISLNVSVTAIDTDGSETITANMSGLPSGTALNAGSLQPDGSYDLTEAELTGLELTPVPDASGSFTLTLRIDVEDTATDPGGMTQTDNDTVTETLDVFVAPQADLPTVVTSPSGGDEDTDIPLNITLTPADTDGSQTITGNMSGLPPGSSLSGGSLQPDGSYDLTESQITSVEFIPAPGISGNYTLSLRVDVEDFATDSGGATVSDVDFLVRNVDIVVVAVNDPPIVVGSINDLTMDEDDPAILHPVDMAFDDPDIATSGDYLVYEIVGNTQPAMFDALVVSGNAVNVDLAQDANGSATVSVAARDSAGVLSPSVSFTVTVISVNDQPDAIDDAVSMLEDGGELRISPMSNDYLPDDPHIISAVTQPTTYQYKNANDDVVVASMGSVTIDGTDVLFTPSENFWGDATFDYTIRDPQGEEDTATITVTVQEQNDAPEAQLFLTFATFQNTDLVIDLQNIGVRRDEYDIDNAKLDAMGNEIQTQVLNAVFETDPPPTEGFLFNLSTDGTFVFRPAADFLGVTGFDFSIIDDGTPFLKSIFGTVQIEVIEPPDDPDDPTPGEVSVLFNLSNTPLEQASTVAPNVLVTMDDSGSMDWHVTIDGLDDNARFVIDNSTIATSGAVQTVSTYLWPLSVNAYSNTSGCCGRILPSQESLPPGTDYNVWEARSSAFNSLYYNPTITYLPWSGVDNNDNDFAPAVPTAIRLDPMTGSSNLLNILNPMSWTASGVPRWATGGGSANISVTNYYVPRYYTSAGVRVDIVSGSSYPGGPERNDCAGTGTTNLCTYAEEIQNFANWFQYYRSRELVSKAAIGSVVADLQDIRVGYETINRRSAEPIADMNDYYWEGDKRELLDTIYNVNSSGGTPLRRALNDAGTILGCTHGSKPCPALPEPEGVCQQNFTLLFSDGYWNGPAQGVGNADADGAGPFDGGKYADSNTDVLADVAMHYYENDLLPGTTDGVPVTRADTEGAPPGTFATTEMHQHMKTYTIAFGVEGAVDVAAAQAADPSLPFSWPGINSAATAKVDDMLHAAINGRGRFLNAGDPQELQTAIETAFLEFTQAGSSTSAAAFNSTSLREDTLLYRGFYDLRNRTGELTATEVDTTDGSLAATPTWTAAELLDATHPQGVPHNNRIIATYDALANDGIPFRSGNLNANQLATLTANEVNYIRGDRTFEEPTGSLRQRLPTEGLLGDIVNSSPIFVGKPRAFNRDQEPYPTGTGNYYSDFVDSVEDRTPIVYVGANDGMLHGFDAEQGTELFAYVPNLIIDDTLDFGNRLDAFTSSFYLHNYYVDLTPRFNDVYMRASASSSKNWMTVVVGGLGAGGKGVYAINVTDPDTQFATETAAANAVLWEFSDQDDTYPLLPDGSPLGGTPGAVTDPNGNPVKDLGYSLSLPVVTMSNVQSGGEQEWVAIFGNGPNSTAGIATLFVLKMDGGHDGWTYGTDFVKIPTTAGVPLPGEQLEGYPNGLGSPTAVDIDLNGTVDLVYAGDRLGNLWRFDLRDTNQNNWSATKVFTATYDNGNFDEIQAILSAPLVTKHPNKPGFLITVGTGSFVAEEDGESTEIQSIYTIWDNYVNTSPPTAQPDSKTLRLVQQVITNVVDDSINPPQTRRIVTSNPVDYREEAPGLPGVFGWYVDLNMPRAALTLSGATNPDSSGEAPPDPQFPGERAIRRILFRDGNIFTTTVVPATDETSCTGARPGSILIFNALTGGDPVDPLIDFNLDGEVEEGDLVDVGGDLYSGGILFNQDDLDGALVDLSTLGGSGDTDFLFVSGGSETQAYRTADLDDDKVGRQSWTQLRED